MYVVSLIIIIMLTCILKLPCIALKTSHSSRTAVTVTWMMMMMMINSHDNRQLSPNVRH